LYANNAATTEIGKAAIDADEAFERQLKLITNSDPDALPATEKDKAVVEFLRKRGLNKGQYLKVSRDSAISARSEYD
jgi:DNA transposition AAA+ family ATPase